MLPTSIQALEINAIEIVTLIVVALIVVLNIFLVALFPAARKKIKKYFFWIFRDRRAKSQAQLIDFSDKIAKALVQMSNDRTGALITIEMKDPLDEYIELGHQITSTFTPELAFSIFYTKKSPLHDGAMIVRDGKVVSVSTYFPTTSKSVDVNYGARHRAALGISESTDSLTFIVSETSGKISMARNKELTTLTSEIEDLTLLIARELASSKRS